MTTRAEAHETPRSRGEGGTGMVEMALIGIVLLLLVFGIINYGLLLSFKQDMTRAAAEGARAGAVALPDPNLTGTDDPRFTSALAATNEAIQAFGGRFGDYDACSDQEVELQDPTPTGLACEVALVECPEDPLNLLCTRVKLLFDQDNFKLYGRIPLFSELPPNTITAESVARVNQ
jgi:hypothetical protein